MNEQQQSGPVGGLPQPPPQVAMLQLLTGRWVSQALGAAARLGLADHVGNDPTGVDEIARSTGTNPDGLYRLLRALTVVGVFQEHGGRQFSITPLGATLKTDVLGSMRWVAAYTNDPWALNCWSFLDKCVTTGTTCFEEATGAKVWDYFEMHPEEGEHFNKGMTAISSMVVPAVIEAYDFGQFGTVADIGGGHGVALSMILARHPNMKGILFDQPSVVAGAPELLGQTGVAGRVEVVGGSFFESVPTGADAYVMKNIIHDWDDTEAEEILKTVARSMSSDAKCLLIEWAVPPAGEPCFSKLLDLEMLAVPGGRERTRDEYAALFEKAGLKLTDVVRSASGSSVIEAVKA